MTPLDIDECCFMIFVNVVSDVCDRERRNVLSTLPELTRVSVRGTPELRRECWPRPTTTSPTPPPHLTLIGLGEKLAEHMYIAPIKKWENCGLLEKSFFSDHVEPF